MRLNKKIIFGMAFAVLLLNAFPTEVSATVICKQGETFLSFPGTDPNICRSVQATPASAEEAAAYTANPASAKDLKLNAEVEKRLAGSTELDCKAGITQCLAVIMYYIGPGIAGYIASIGAYFFSIVIQLSLNSTAYALNFLTDGWTTVRDIANMSFIFILVYIAMTVMLQAETAGTVKTLAIVVVIALLVNFSFFFTRVVIDAGNILALQFYNAIPTTPGVATINGVKDLSGSLMGAASPHVLLSSDMFNRASKTAGDSGWGILGIYTVIYLSVAAMLWMLFFAFIQVGIKFMLRIVGLWFLLIASPLAFVARTMPKTKPYFDQWFKKLVEFSLYPAIFLFMFLILTRFAGTLINGQGGSILNAVSHAFDNTGTGGDVTSATGVIASVAIRMGFVIALMYVALKVSDWVVKEGSGIASSVTDRIAGVAKGVGRFGGGLPVRGLAAGGGVLGRNTVGWAGSALSRSTWARGMEAKSGIAGIFGRGLREVGKAAGNRTYDARNIPGAGAVLGAGGVLNVGAGQKDGYIKRTADAASAKEKRGKDLEPTAGEKLKAQSDKKYQAAKQTYGGVLAAANKDIEDADREIAHLSSLGYGSDEAKIKKAQAEIVAKNAKAALASNEKYLKEISGEGSKKVYGESLLISTNLAAGNPGFITRSSREAAAKILNEKSRKEKLAEAAAEYEKEEHGNDTPDGGGGGSSGGGGARGGGSGGGSTSGGGTHASPAGGGGTHAFLGSKVESAVEKNTEVLKRMERLLKRQANTTQHLAPASAPDINVSELGKAIGKSVAKNLERSGNVHIGPLPNSGSASAAPQRQPPRPNNDNEMKPPEAKAA